MGITMVPCMGTAVRTSAEEGFGARPDRLAQRIRVLFIIMGPGGPGGGCGNQGFTVVGAGFRFRERRQEQPGQDRDDRDDDQQFDQGEAVAALSPGVEAVHGA